MVHVVEGKQAHTAWKTNGYHSFYVVDNLEVVNMQNESNNEEDLYADFPEADTGVSCITFLSFLQFLVVLRVF
jgi:hypothetical protein